MKIRFRRTDFGAAVLGAFLCMVILFLITLYRDGGELHQESAIFMMNYLDGRPLLATVIDPYNNDLSMYQARELSYFFDYLDAHFVAFLMKKHIVWFFSLCSLCLCGLMIFCQQYFTRKLFPKIPGLMVTAFSVLFVLSAAVNGLNYFRCAKYLTALGLWCAFFAGYAAYRFGTPGSRICFLLSLLLMILSDRQGFFFAAATCGTAGLLMLYLTWKHTAAAARRMRFIVVGTFAMTAAGIVNNLWLTPAAVARLNGYHPNFAYQREIVFEAKNLLDGLLFFFSNAGNWFTDWPGSTGTAALLGALLTGALAWELAAEHRKGKRRAIPLALLWLCAIGAIVVCAAGMAARHPAIMQPEVIYSAYALPALVICFALLTLTAAGGTKRFPRILLCLLLAGTALRLGTELCVSRFSGDSRIFQGYNRGQPVLKRAIREPGFNEEKYCMPHRMELFLEFYRKRLLQNR